MLSACTPLVVGSTSVAPNGALGLFQVALSRAAADHSVTVTAQAVLPATAEFALYRSGNCS